MLSSILATKLYIPPPQPKNILRTHLIQQLNEGLSRKLTLVSAAAGFGKTTLVSGWVNQKDEGRRMKDEGSPHPSKVAWLSLDEGDNDPTRFLTYVVAALQTIVPDIGADLITRLQSPQPPPPESVLTALLNEINSIPDKMILVLDDYHLVNDPSVDKVLNFLLQHLPPQLHLVIATREDPNLPLSRLRVRGQLTEIRATDLRFTPAEVAEFFNQAMGLNLSLADIDTLETRTEGWVAGLQLAALALGGQQDATHFIQSFTGSHRFVLDYLVEEVLQQQPANVQEFLLHTSILDRLCGALCDAVFVKSAMSGQETLTYLEQANLFIIPLDDERRWYRYHHLFADLLQQRLQQKKGKDSVADYHRRASIWYEENDLEIEAFHHAVAANDVVRAEHLMEGNGMPLQFRGAMVPVMHWLGSLPTAVLEDRPTLLVNYALALTMAGQPISDIEEKLHTAESILQDAEPNDKTRDLIGQIAAIRAMLAIPHNQIENMIIQSQRALKYLHLHNLPVRTTATWTLGLAYQFQGNRVAASQTYNEVIAISQKSGNTMVSLAATIGIGSMQAEENQLYLAAESFQHCLQLAGDPPLAGACVACLGLAHIHYEWNQLDVAQQYGQQGLQLALQMETVDTPAACETFLARVQLAQGDVARADALLTKAEQFMRVRNFVEQMPEIIATQVLTLLHQGNLADAAHLAETHDLPLSQARVCLAQGDTTTALSILASWQQMNGTPLPHKKLEVMILQTAVYGAAKQTDKAMQLLSETLTLAKAEGFIRSFVDEGATMAALLTKMQREAEQYFQQDVAAMKTYIQKLLAACGEPVHTEPPPNLQQNIPPQPLLDPLSPRELEVLQLVAQGLSNREISERLFLALDTVKGHNRRIYGKLQVQRRTEAVARARELGLL